MVVSLFKEDLFLQVTGELSNSGQPMRRFMQTFVLAPQSPKKYYVHNDIFRYQDEVFHDNDSDMENCEEGIADDIGINHFKEYIYIYPKHTVNQIVNKFKSL